MCVEKRSYDAAEGNQNMHSEKICTFLFLLQERRITEQLGAAKLMH